MARLVALLVLTACGSHARPQASSDAKAAPIAPGDMVSAVLARCHATYAELRFEDEPPGKLRAVTLPCREGTPRNLELELTYTTELFSAERTWPEALVGPQRVTAVRWR